MRCILLGVALMVAACGGGRKAGGPAWPKSAGAAEAGPAGSDGGESLEPQQAVSVAAVERAEDKTPSSDAAATVVVEAPAMPVEVPALPPSEDAKPAAAEIEVIEIKPEDLEVDP